MCTLVVCGSINLVSYIWGGMLHFILLCIWHMCYMNGSNSKIGTRYLGITNPKLPLSYQVPAEVWYLYTIWCICGWFRSHPEDQYYPTHAWPKRTVWTNITQRLHGCQFLRALDCSHWMWHDNPSLVCNLNNVQRQPDTLVSAHFYQWMLYLFVNFFMQFLLVFNLEFILWV